MKSLYVCEKCGKVFEEYDMALACERMHEIVYPIYSWDMPSDSGMATEFYAQGEIAPEYVVLKVAELDKDDYIKTHTMPNGNNVTKYRAVVYKRVDKVKLPNGMTPNDYTDAMLRQQIADNPKEDETEEGEG